MVGLQLIKINEKKKKKTQKSNKHMKKIGFPKTVPGRSVEQTLGNKTKTEAMNHNSSF